MNNIEQSTLNHNQDNLNQECDTNQINENLFNKIINLNKETNKNELIEIFMSVDAHYGHRINSWNPLMARYLFAQHGDVHIIDLTKTIYLLSKALKDIIKIFSESNARMLFVGSKEQLTEVIKNQAERCGQYYVNHRWFGGTLTNWSTIQNSIKKMDVVERDMFENRDLLSKKQLASKSRVLNKLENSLGGIRKMSSLPDIIFVTDTRKERVSIAEANKLGIPVIALLDSNSNPKGVDYPIPCNDDNQRAVNLVCQLIADAVLAGMELSFEKKETASRQRRENDKSSSSTYKKRNFVRNEQKNNNKTNEDNVKITEEQSSNHKEDANNNKETTNQSTNKTNTNINKMRKNFIVSDPKKSNSNRTGFQSAASTLVRRNTNNNSGGNKNSDK